MKISQKLSRRLFRDLSKDIGALGTLPTNLPWPCCPACFCCLVSGPVAALLVVLAPGPPWWGPFNSFPFAATKIKTSFLIYTSTILNGIQISYLVETKGRACRRHTFLDKFFPAAWLILKRRDAIFLVID